MNGTRMLGQRWRVYSDLKMQWIRSGGKCPSVRDILRSYPDIDENELQEGIVEFRLMEDKHHEGYGFRDLDAEEVEEEE